MRVPSSSLTGCMIDVYKRQAGHAGNAHKFPQGNFHIDILQVILGGAPDFQKFPVSLSALFGNLYFFLPTEILAGNGALTGLYPCLLYTSRCV